MAQVIDPAKYKHALQLAALAEESVSLTYGRYDEARWPVLQFPEFSIPTVTAAVSPDSSYRFLEEAISAAQSSLLLYIYDVSAAYLLDLLAKAKARGVKIRAMYDPNSQGTAELAALKQVGTVKAAPSGVGRHVFTVCHQKFIVIDGKTVVVESANWAKSAIPKITSFGGFVRANREWFIRIDSTEVAAWFTAFFDADYAIPPDAGAAVGQLVLHPASVTIAADVVKPSKLFDKLPISDPQATMKPVLSPDNYYREVRALLKAATKSIYLQQQYILAGKGVKELVATIAQRQRDFPNLKVRIVGSATFPEGWEGTKATLDSAGLLGSLKAINPKSFGHCHNKGVLVDGKSVVVSSTNWSSNSLLRAREAGVMIRSAKIAGYYEEAFLVDWNEGLTPAQVHSQLSVLDGADALV